MDDEEAALKGAIRYVQKNTSYEEIRAMVTGGSIAGNRDIPLNTPAPRSDSTIGIDDVIPAVDVDEVVSGKEAEGEGEKLEGELVRQKLSIEGKSTAEILAELKSLYENGLITEVDYERKKAEILEKM